MVSQIEEVAAIDIGAPDCKLVVEGNKEEKEDKDQLVFKGLAQRSFTRSWGISDDTEVQKVEFEDGLLTVTVGKIIPEHHARKDWL